MTAFRRWLVGALVGLCIGPIAAQGDGAPTLFGSYAVNDTMFRAMNEWLNGNTSADVRQSIQVLDIGWDHVDTVTNEIRRLYHAWNVNKAVPVVTWMPYPYLNWGSPTPNNDVVDGLYDAYLDTFYSALQTFLAGPDGALGSSDDRRAYLRFAPAPNGNWFPWSPQCPPCAGTGQHINQTVDSYAAMFHYVIDKARYSFNLTSDALQVMWQVNSFDAYGVPWTMEEFYPGDFYVDWVGIGGFNWGTTLPGNSWLSVPALFSDAQTRIGKIIAPGTPVALVTLASTSTPDGVWTKDEWMRGIFDVIVASQSRRRPTSNPIRMFAYHNADGQTDLAVFGGAKGFDAWRTAAGTKFWTYNAFRDGITANSWLVAADPANPRLIPHDAFFGS